MNLFLSSLAKACQKYLLQEKRLVVPSYQAGNVLCETLAQSGMGWVNLRTETPTGLALRAAGDYLAEHQITLLSGYAVLSAVEEIFLILQEEGRFQYFARLNPTQGLVEALTSALQELRECGVKSSSLADDDFICPEKGQDIRMLLHEYEHYLIDHCCLDHPGLISLALTLVPDYLVEGDDLVYLVPSFLQWKPLENDLISKLAGDRLLCLPVETTAGKEDIRDGSVVFSHAYGMANELRNVLRQVLEKKIPLDQVSVACTKDEYIPALYSLSRMMGFGLTIFEGIPVSLTGPGRVLQGIVNWINSDFSVSTLINLCTSGDVVLHSENSGEEIDPLAASRLLKNSGIGWGRDRYQLLQESENGSQLHLLIQSLLEQISVPDERGRVSFQDFCSGLTKILIQLSRVKDELDREALSAITSCVHQTAAYCSFELGLEDAVERLTKILENLRVGHSGPKPGQLHLTSYRNLIWSRRPHTFVVGLDAGTFPGDFRQDPVLLDSERQKIHVGLSLGANKLEEKQFLMATALASRRGQLVLSYPSYDVVENRDAYPASILLQVYRLLEGDQAPDYSDLLNYLGPPVGYCSQDGNAPLDEVEWWICRNLAGDLKDAAVVGQCYEGIARGQTAVVDRQEEIPTAYDGALTTSGDTAPWLSRRILSCSQIEYLASCPFAYFLKYVLGVYPPDEVSFDPTRWLDPLGRGNLLHNLFCGFMREITALGEQVEPEKHKNYLFEMAGELIELYKEKIPPPSDLVLQSEVSEILECCDVFLTTESRRGSTPRYFEVPFGMGPEEVEKAGCGLADPVRLDLGQGKVLAFRGRIDRIDQLPNGNYCIWDYKTGSARNYGEQLFFNKGRQVQHALYALAAEEILKKISPGKIAKVESAGYIFPTRKGEGRHVTHSAKNREMLVDLLNTAYEIVESGTFVTTHDDSRCHYCEYATICTPERAVPRAKVLYNSRAAARMDPWRRLQEYV